jgi:hypothetical protein
MDLGADLDVLTMGNTVYNGSQTPTVQSNSNLGTCIFQCAFHDLSFLTDPASKNRLLKIYFHCR